MALCLSGSASLHEDEANRAAQVRKDGLYHRTGGIDRRRFKVTVMRFGVVVQKDPGPRFALKGVNQF